MKKKKISDKQLGPLRGSLSPLKHFESARVKPNWVSIQPKSAGWPALLTASAFNPLGQYASSPGNKAYCYTELAVYSLAVIVTTASTNFSHPPKDGQAELTWVAYSRILLRTVMTSVVTNSSTYYLNTIANSQEFSLFKIVFQ